MANQTDWNQVKQAALSTCYDPGKQKINLALVDILQRFEVPLGRYFARRLGCCYPSEQQEEIYAEFCVHVIQSRKKIFRQADPTGKLQSYLYAIAWSFANRYLGKQRRAASAQEEIVGVSLRENTPLEEIENREQDEYARMILGLTLTRLKNHDRAKYELLSYKYFTGTQAPSAREIAVILGMLSSDLARNEPPLPEVSRCENAIYQRLTRARNTFFQLMEQEIRLALQAFDIDDCADGCLVAEKIALCRPYLEKGREVVDADFQIKLPGGGPNTWSGLLTKLQPQLTGYLDNCLRCLNLTIIVDPRHLFEELLGYSVGKIEIDWKMPEQFCRRAYLCAWEFLENYLRQNNLVEVGEASATGQCHYALLVMELALVKMQRFFDDKYRLLVRKYFSGDKPSGYQLAVCCGLIEPRQDDDLGQIKESTRYCLSAAQKK